MLESFGLDSSQVGGLLTLGFRGLDSSKLQDSTSNEDTDAFLNPFSQLSSRLTSRIAYKL